MNDELSDFTKLVLARLETNPDEFQINSRWDTLVRGIEAYAIDETENRYHRTLWALTDHERVTILNAYRKAYLARLHKDMLKNIVSGDDLSRNTLSTGTLRGTSPNTILTPANIANQALGVLQKEFDSAYDANRYSIGMTDTAALYGAVVKGEGQQIQDSNMSYNPTNRFSLNASQLAVCKKLGMDPVEYAMHVERFQG